MRILTTFIQPIWMLFEEAKILRKALHEYEAWLLRENQDRKVYATGLSPVARVSYSCSDCKKYQALVLQVRSLK